MRATQQSSKISVDLELSICELWACIEVFRRTSLLLVHLAIVSLLSLEAIWSVWDTHPLFGTEFQAIDNLYQVMVRRHVISTSTPRVQQRTR